MKNPKLIILTCLFLTLFLGIVFLWPKYQQYIKTKNSLASKEEFLKNNNEYFKKIKEMFVSLEDDKNLKELAAKVIMAIPARPDYDKLVGYLEKTANENGLIIIRIKISEPAEIDEFKEKAELKKIKGTKIFISLFGTYSSFGNFLSKIEKSARLFEVESISFNAPQSSSGASQKTSDISNVFNFDLQLRVYSY